MALHAIALNAYLLLSGDLPTAYTTVPAGENKKFALVGFGSSVYVHASPCRLCERNMAWDLCGASCQLAHPLQKKSCSPGMFCLAFIFVKILKLRTFMLMRNQCDATCYNVSELVDVGLI